MNAEQLNAKDMHFGEHKEDWTTKCKRHEALAKHNATIQFIAAKISSRSQCSSFTCGCIANLVGLVFDRFLAGMIFV
jgi:hypothetical protein